MLSNKKQEDLLRDAEGEFHWLYSADLKGGTGICQRDREVGRDFTHGFCLMEFL